jgi:ubiquinone biosynthesis accessory factor UbiK
MPAGRPQGINGLGHALDLLRTALALPRDAGALTGCGFSAMEKLMGFMDSNALDELARRLADAVPPALRDLGRDLENNFKAVLQAQLAKLDLVSRNEFDVQAALLARTQVALAAMEARLKDIEAKLP